MYIKAVKYNNDALEMVTKIDQAEALLMTGFEINKLVESGHVILLFGPTYDASDTVHTHIVAKLFDFNLHGERPFYWVITQGSIYTMSESGQTLSNWNA